MKGGRKKKGKKKKKRSEILCADSFRETLFARRNGDTRFITP